VSEERRRRKAIRKLAALRVRSVWNCVNVLRPDLPLEEQKALARTFLDLGRQGYRSPAPIRIAKAQVSEMVWLNSQCANRYCSMLLFAENIANELNEFFRQDDRTES
jgi:hypothetical protein